MKGYYTLDIILGLGQSVTKQSNSTNSKKLLFRKKSLVSIVNQFSVEKKTKFNFKRKNFTVNVSVYKLIILPEHTESRQRLYNRQPGQT